MKLTNVLVAILCLHPTLSIAQQLDVCAHAGGGPMRPREPVKYTDALPLPDIIEMAQRCVRDAQGKSLPLAVPASRWFQADAALYSATLKRAPVDTLVIPVETQANGFDRIERALMSGVIADVVENPRERVVDPLLTARALGEPLRKFDDAAVWRLAESLHAKTVIRTFAGHDEAHRMTVAVQRYSCSWPGQCKLAAQYDLRGVTFTNEVPPFLQLAKLAADVRRGLGFAGATPRVVRPAKTFTERRITVPPAKVVSASDNLDPLDLSALLASLSPLEDGLGADRLFTVLLRDALKTAGTHPRHRLLAAFAALELHRRPLGLQLLNGVSDPAADAFRALLDGNLAEAQAALTSVKDPLLLLLGSIALQDLRATYGRDEDIDAKTITGLFGSAPGAWSSLVERRVSDPDRWAATNDVELKRLLDEFMPDPAFTRRGQDSSSALKVSLVRHIRAALARLDPAQCCGVGARAATAWQMYWLIELSVEANLAKDLERVITLQALPAAADKLFETLDEDFTGLPVYEAWRGANLDAMSKLAPNSLQLEIATKAARARQIAGYWAQGQTRTAYRTVAKMMYADGPALNEGYVRDYPPRAWWQLAPGGMQFTFELQRSRLCERVEFADRDPEAVSGCFGMTRDPAAQRALRANLEARFKGHAVMDAARQPSRAPIDHLTMLRNQVTNDPSSANYTALGDHLVENGNFEEAQRVYLQFPGLDAAELGNSVGLGNYAYAAGSMLYWRGLVDLARPLYEHAARLENGSEASMVSASRLHLLDGDLEAAMDEAVRRSQRYPGPYSYREVLVLAYLMGSRESSWEGFLETREAFDVPQTWNFALVAQRHEAAPVLDQRRWMLRDEIRDARYRGKRLAPIYALWWATADRKPNADTVTLLEQIEKGADRRIAPDGVSTSIPSFASENVRDVLRPSKLFHRNVPKLAAGTPVKSEYVMLADALASTASGNHEVAVTKFRALADHYPIDSGDLAVALPYMAYSAAKSGDTQGLAKLIDATPEGQLDYNGLLAKAAIHGVAKRVDVAERWLKKALNLRMHTDSRPIMSEYQYAEFCEILYAETGDDRFRRALVDWVRSWQTIQPMYAWAFAMEMTHTKVEAHRTRAIGMTLFLDPDSPRLKKIDAKRIEAARVWLKTNNPFTLRRKPEKG
jgi:hypothetical protein